MNYMIIEKFKPGKAKDVYQRFAEKGRLAPDGLDFINSWVSKDVSTCYQVMHTDDYGKLEQWMDNWRDLMDFEVIPVISSQEAKAKL